MPTAGEYKHEPSGIPCHCYVRRRLHHSACKKSCIRKNSDSSSQYSDSKPKKVTFNPILSVRSYDSDSAEVSEPRKPLKCTHGETTPKNVSQKSTLCDRLTSLFGLSHCKPSPKREPEVSQNSKDYNNNDLDHSEDMSAEKYCALCESKRNRSPVQGIYQRTRERTPSPCGFHQSYSSCTSKGRESPQYQRYASTSEYSSRNPPPTPFTRRYHSPRRLFKRDSFSGTSNRNGSLEYETMDTISYTPSAAANTKCDINGTVELGPFSTYISGKPNQANQINPKPISIDTHTEHDKLEEYIYEVPINNKSDKHYEYISIKSSRKPSASENYHGNVVTIPILESNTYEPPNLIKHKTEIDLTDDTIRHKIIRPPSDPPAIITSPYDIQFIHEPPNRPCPRNTEEVEMFDRASTMDTNSVMFGARRPLQKPNTPLADILKLTPIAFFWTGCAFLIAMIYVCVFPCPMDDEE